MVRAAKRLLSAALASLLLMPELVRTPAAHAAVSEGLGALYGPVYSAIIASLQDAFRLSLSAELWEWIYVLVMLSAIVVGIPLVLKLVYKYSTMGRALLEGGEMEDKSKRSILTWLSHNNMSMLMFPVRFATNLSATQQSAIKLELVRSASFATSLLQPLIAPLQVAAFIQMGVRLLRSSGLTHEVGTFLFGQHICAIEALKLPGSALGIISVWTMMRMGRRFKLRLLAAFSRAGADVEHMAAPGVRSFFNVCSIFVYAIGGAMALEACGVNVRAIWGALGFSGFAVGFAAKDFFANIVGGASLVVRRPFTVGDVISINGGNPGKVVDISLGTTTILDTSGVSRAPNIIPNQQVMGKQIKVLTRAQGRYFDVVVNLVCDSSAVMAEVSRQCKDMLLEHPMVINDPLDKPYRPHAVLIGMDRKSGIQLRVKAVLRIANPVDFAECQQELLLEVWQIIERTEGARLCLPASFRGRLLTAGEATTAEEEEEEEARGRRP